MSEGLDSRVVAENAEWVRSTLEASQLSANKAMHYSRRKLKRGEMPLFWGLRIYLLFMLGIVFYQVWTSAH
jgi:hypothetical protein